MVSQTVYSVVIFSHSFLESDCINFKTFAFLAVYWPFWTSLYNTDIKVQQFLKSILHSVNPILTGGGSIWPPPCTKSATASRPPQIAKRLFMTFFFQVLRIFWYQVCENRTVGREVTWRFVLARRHKICPKSAFCIGLCTKHMEITDFLKCTKTVFILSFWPFAQFLISWN